MDFADFVRSVHPYDSLPSEELERVIGRFAARDFAAGEQVYARGEYLAGVFLIQRGSVEVEDATGTVISQLFPRNSLGERGLLADGFAATTARAVTDATLLLLPASEFKRLMAQQPVFSRFFTRGRQGDTRRTDFATQKVAELMSAPAMTCAPTDSVRAVARSMAERHVSSLAVVDGDERLVGIVTTRDLVNRVLAPALDPAATPVSAVMTNNPMALGPEALGSDVLNLMLGKSVGHVPVVEDDRLLGMITQTDLTHFEAVSATRMVADIAGTEVEKLPQVTERIPQLLVQLVGAGNPPETVSRLITDITDAVTRRLLSVAEERLGPPPVPYVWLACGSQGRQEQTGKTDQDNCIILSDDFKEDDRPWFAALARFVSDNLNTCGYVYCPGQMMATNPRWCQPAHVWNGYFEGWIESPQPMAQMLASVMFDLRPIFGHASLFEDLQARTLRQASENSIFVAHMIRNSLSHSPPLGLLRGFATVSAGEHRNRIDLKLNGVVPVVDLARVYSLIGELAPVNTRARLLAAEERGVISSSGGRDLVAAYDLIAEFRLRNQAAQIKAGQKPDNFLSPYELGDFERSHLRDAFVVVRTMQSALAHGRSALF